MSRPTPTLLEQISANTAPGPFHEPDIAGRRAPADPKVRLIAFYLPQYHCIPENDAWWGTGFTEWTNVTKALPRFVGHIQPRLPADLGFYDLRRPQTLRQQADLARRHGIHGFCFHHYWFAGRRLLEKPLELLLADPSIDLPFCLNYANENWTRRWDGFDDDVLIGQRHSPEDDVAFARSLIPAVRDPRYIHVDGRPLLMLYRPGLLPDPLATMRRWRVEFARAGLPNPYILMAQAFDAHDPRLYGIDAAVEFPPHKLGDIAAINDTLTLLDPDYDGRVIDYRDIVANAANTESPAYKLYRGVSPGWDNEPRRPGRGFTLAYATPPAYGRWLAASCQAAVREAQHDDERMVFVNAWNEWAEGATLEPDRHFGHAYLAETARVLKALDQSPTSLSRAPADRPRIALISHDAHFHGAQFLALAVAHSLVVDHDVCLTVLLGDGGELTPNFAALCHTETLGGSFNDTNQWSRAAERLIAAGVTTILCNTCVSAQAIPSLHAAGLRIVLLVHELPSLIRRYHLVEAVMTAARLADVVVFASDHVRDRFVEIAGSISGAAVVRPQGVHMQRLSDTARLTERARARKMLGVADDRFVVLGMGYGDRRKGLDLWPALIGRLVAQCDTAVFVWIGLVESDLLHWVEHDLAAAGLAGRLLLPGITQDLAAAYAAADAFVLTSREDPFPSVVLEAMASALPTIVFDGSGGIVDLVRDSGGGVVPYLDVAAMADALAVLQRDPAAAAAMGAALAARIERDFGFSDYTASLLRLCHPALPSVSVVVPNYNYAHHLPQRLHSIWAQTAAIAEIILLDDASTDDSATVIDDLMAQSPIPIRLIRNAANSGSVSRQWQRGIAAAASDIVWIAEADDYADPDFLRTVLAAFADRHVVLSYCESRAVDTSGKLLMSSYRAYVADLDPARWTTDYIAPGRDEIALALSVKNTIPNVSAALIRRAAAVAVLDRALEPMAACRNAGDWLFYLELLAQGGRIAFTSRPLNNHRRHGSGVTFSGDNRRHLQEVIAMQDRAAALVELDPAMRASALAYRGLVAAAFGLRLEDAT